MSAPTSNRLVYTTPSISSIFNGRAYSDFEGFDEINMTLEVTTTTMGETLACGNASNCAVKYSWGYTPVIHYVIPSIVYPGMTGVVAVNPKNAPNYKKSTDLPIDLRIDGTALNLTTYHSASTLPKNSVSYVYGLVQTELRNATSDVSAFFRGAGYAINDTDTIQTCLYDGATCYRAKVLPTVTSVEPTFGYANGGQDITITGTSLDGDTVTVTVDGLPCEVKSTSLNEVVCTTTAKSIDPDAEFPLSYIGSQGLTRYVFGNKGGWHSSWRDHMDDSDELQEKMIHPAIDMAFDGPYTNQF